MTGQSAFGRKEAKAAFAAFQSLSTKPKIQMFISIAIAVTRTFITLMTGFAIGRWTG